MSNGIRNNSIVLFLYKTGLLILFLQSMYAWFLWWGQFFFAIVVSLVFTITFLVSSKAILCYEKSNIIPVLFFIILQLYVVKDENTNSFIAALLRIFVISTVLILNDKLKTDILNFLTKAFAILMAISLFAWLVFLAGIPLPHFPTSYYDGHYLFENYYFFLLTKGETDALIPRFSGVFLEPGHLGMISSFLIYANRFNLKNKTVLIIFVCTLFTFSLVAYILLAISAIAYFTIGSKKPFRNFAIIIVLTVTVIAGVARYNNGDNLVNNYILIRLKVENGEIVGNNRFTPFLNTYYKQFINSDDKLFGIGPYIYHQTDWGGGNAGFKVFILQYGIIGLVLVFLFYFTLVVYRSSKLAWILLFIYLLSFLQRAYALWEVELLIFITALPILSMNEKINAHDQ